MKTRGYVLVVDDDDDSRALVLRWLTGAGMLALEASSGEEALALTEQHADAIEAIVTDVNMSGIDGCEMAKRLRGSPSTAPIPMIMMSGNATHEEDAVRGVESGAVDYLAKPVSAPLLVAKLRALTAIRRELLSAQQSASTDPMTGLYNRWSLDQRLREEAAFCARRRVPFAVVLVDIDHFKQVNDTYGHAEGDRVIVAFADAIRNVLRSEDVAFRQGGEEFLILLRGCDAQQAAGVALRLRERLESRPVTLGRTDRRVVAFSGGIAVGDESNGWAASGLVESADDALYRAKRAGRNRVHVAV